MLATMLSFFIVALLCLVRWSNSESCPAKYLRLTTHHTFCVQLNPSCQVLRTGVSKEERRIILWLHNEFRSKVAMGQEDRVKGGQPLPQAADMMQMDWDNELAAVAQKWTENCILFHDCDICKEVENFPVGQNLYSTSNSGSEPDWKTALKSFYSEVFDYYTSWLGSFEKHPGTKTDDLTQFIWSRTWRVGCGYSHYKKGGTFHQYYVCNYGPTGNVKREPVYKPGKPCSACPTNTICQTYSTGYNSFPGLCRMIDPNTAPDYPINQEGLLFHCGFSAREADCRASTSGDGSWKTIHSIGGNYYSVLLQKGQSTTLTFDKPITPRKKQFCIKLNFRKGPLYASRNDDSSFQTNYKTKGDSPPPTNLKSNKTSFTDLDITLPWKKKTTLSFTFSLPRRAWPHALDIRKIVAYDGRCP